jgi:hypothetical protein
MEVLNARVQAVGDLIRFCGYTSEYLMRIYSESALVEYRRHSIPDSVQIYPDHSLIEALTNLQPERTNESTDRKTLRTLSLLTRTAAVSIRSSSPQ